MGGLVFPVVIGTSLWVLVDAKSIGVKRGQLKGFFDIGPVGWFFGCLLLWIVCFPAYLSKRAEYKRINVAALAPPTSVSDAITQLERVAQLKEKGISSAEEFARPRTRPIGITLIAMIYWVVSGLVIREAYYAISHLGIVAIPGVIGLAIVAAVFATTGLGLWRVKNGALVPARVLQCLFAVMMVRSLIEAIASARRLPWDGAMESMTLALRERTFFELELSELREIVDAVAAVSLVAASHWPEVALGQDVAFGRG